MIRQNFVRMFLCVLVFSGLSQLYSYEVTLHGGSRMDIPEAWMLDESDLSIPAWYSPDRKAGAQVMLWPPDSWESMESFLDEVRPEGAQGEITHFPHWGGDVAIADWTFSTDAGQVRGWFLFTMGTGSDVRVSAIAGEMNYQDVQHFLLSIIDSYMPSASWKRSPGAIGHFLEISGESRTQVVKADFNGEVISWNNSPGSNLASQDTIEREALILASYGNNPNLFYDAWNRYYRLIFKDSYSRLKPLADAIKKGPFPPNQNNTQEIADAILNWLQGFSYGSTNGFSDLLAPSTSTATGIGDCDSLALVLIILMDGYGVDGRILISPQAQHAVAALDVPGKGMRYVEGDRSWLTAELTARLPIGVLPERLETVTDWFGINLLGDR